MGRPSIYNDEIAEEICQLIGEGKPLTEICKLENMPDYRTVMRWRATRPDFSQMYAIAREDQADTLADEILTIADDALHDWSKSSEGFPVLNSEHVQRARLRIDSRKWLAGKLRPKKYGDKVDLNHGGQEGNPVALSMQVSFVKPDPER